MGTAEYKTKRVMNDSTQDKRVWKGIIGVTWRAPERALYELPAETGRRRNHSLPLTSSQRLPGRGGWQFWTFQAKCNQGECLGYGEQIGHGGQ